ncbi:hypothetical protein [Actinoplanes sp. N902-109]|uniref:hypothetical protein n=1 Tax=Actinoplanes sp. (strain N902-109) TaxID=649831 RepID=UPI0003294200|nr:hypothetical protein [Actinoplanes sp. N902-109]AGL19499.1 hypothetical protein L083_5989 [Actinoplanes sp. N902-109]
MAHRVHVDTAAYLQSIRTQILALMRLQGNRVRDNVRDVAPHRTGELDRKLRTRVGWDSLGPFARVSTWARNPRDGYRYGLSLQYRRRYLERGLDRTPRR